MNWNNFYNALRSLLLLTMLCCVVLVTYSFDSDAGYSKRFESKTLYIELFWEINKTDYLSYKILLSIRINWLDLLYRCNEIMFSINWNYPIISISLYLIHENYVCILELIQVYFLGKGWNAWIAYHKNVVDCCHDEFHQENDLLLIT